MTTSSLNPQLATAGNAKSIRKESQVKTSREFNFPASAVWDLIAGFDTLSDYHAAVTASRLDKGGVVRYINISEEAGGGIVVERLMSFDHEAMSFSYAIIELIDSPLPLKNYQAWVNLESTGKNSCKLYWESTFDTREGATKKEAEDIIRIIYQGCYDGITRVLGGE